MVYKRAIVVIHGMGEQRPLDTLDGFMGALLSQYGKPNRRFYSRPARFAESYEARRYIVPPIFDDSNDSTDRRPQTEVFEYHWSHLMRENRLDDLYGTVRRIMLQWPWTVPGGIRGLWLVLWVLIAALAWAFTLGPLSTVVGDGSIDAATVLGVLLGTGLVGGVVTYVVIRVLPSWLTGSFVDVVRYLDTSPRSYEVRRDIRQGAIELLTALNDHYDRVIVVGHSLGAYIGYDAISHVWATRNRTYDTTRPQDPPDGGEVPAGLDKLEQAAKRLDGKDSSDADQQEYRTAQRELQRGLATQKLRWRVTDFITLGAPMYLADQIYTTNRAEFDQRTARHQLLKCPPVEDHPSWKSEHEPNPRLKRFSYENRDGRRVLFHGAAFAVVRWTNLWFPTSGLFFGDYFGGPLAPLFGAGIRDAPINSGSRRRLIPGYAHALYYKLIARHPDEDLARQFHEALRLEQDGTRSRGSSPAEPGHASDLGTPADAP